LPLHGEQFPALLPFPDLLGRLQTLQGRLHLGKNRRMAHPRVQNRCQVGLGAGEIPDHLQEADGLRHPRFPRMLPEVLYSVSDLQAFLVGDVALYEVIDHVQGDQGTHRLFAEVDPGIDDDLLGELDKGAVAAAHVAASAALSTQAGDDLDNKVNLVRKERIELYKLFLGELGTATGPMKTGVHPKGTLVLPVEVPEQPL